MAVDHNNPQSRDEEILIATIDGTEYNKLPQSRMEELLLELKDVIEAGGGGGSVHFVVVEELPTTDIDQTAIYLVPKSTAATSNVYDEYINTDGTTSGWELIGSTDIDLSDYITDDDLATVLEDYATEQDLSGKQDTLTAGKYININANNEIAVNPVVQNEAFTYTIKQIDDYSLEIIKTVDNVVVFDEVCSCWDPVTQQQSDVNETFDDAINIHVYPAGERSYTLLIASDAHEAGFKQTTPWWQRNTFVENFSTVDHSGEKLITKSEMDTELAGKQSVLTAGNYVSITNNGTINVTKSIGVNDVYSYELMSIENGLKIQLTKKINNVTISTQVIANVDYSPTNKLTVDDLFDLWYDLSNFYWHYKLLVDSKEHQKNEEISWYYTTMADYTETFDVSQDSSTDLATKGDVETALALKQDKTDNSLHTTNKTVVGAINEHEGDISSLKSGLTNYEKQNNLNLEVANRKNLVKVTVSSDEWQGVIFVNNNDGTFTTTGSNTGSNPIAFIIGSVSLINGERYEFTGCPSNGGINSYRIDLRSSGTIYDNIVDEGSGYSFTARQNATVDVCIRIAGNYSIPEGGLTFSPMIRPSFITDATFTPYVPSVNSRLNNLANPLGTYNVMGIFQTTQLYNNSYGIAVVTGFDPSIHTVTINSATFIDGSAVTLTYNTHTTKKGVVGFFVDDANAVGKLVNINITVS